MSATRAIEVEPHIVQACHLDSSPDVSKPNYWKVNRKREAYVLAAELKECSKRRDLSRGKQIHSEAVKFGDVSNIFVANALMNLYAKCGSMKDAHEIFDSMEHPNVVFWNVLILGYANNGQSVEALELFSTMRSEGPEPDSITYMAVLKSCTYLGDEQRINRCKKIHILAMETGCDSDTYVQNTLIDMYANCGSMLLARQLFDNHKHRTIVSWNALIMGYAENRQGVDALQIFTRMRKEGILPDSSTFVSAFKACISLALSEGWAECRNWGKAIHNLVLMSGYDSVCYIQSILIDMYIKCGSMKDARLVFERMKHPNVVSWTALIQGYADRGNGSAALDLFARMRSEGSVLDSVVLIAALKACTSLALKEGPSFWDECRSRGSEIHNLAIENGYASDIRVQNTLMDMYAKCGSMENAYQVFNNIIHPTVVSWNVLITGYAENCQGLNALNSFVRMRETTAPDSITYSGVLQACAMLGALEFGRTVHSDIIVGNHLNVVLVTCLVDLYAKCGSLVEAKTVFNLYPEAQDLSTWTALLAGFSNCGDYESVSDLFREMQDVGFKPDGVTLLCVLTCCNHRGLVEKGKECFDSISGKYGIHPTIGHYTCMVDIFGRANRLDDAMALLQCMPCSGDYVSWMTVLGASRKWKNVEIASLAFRSMIAFNDHAAAAFVVMGQIYGSQGMLHEQELVLQMSKKLKSSRKPGDD